MAWGMEQMRAGMFALGLWNGVEEDWEIGGLIEDNYEEDIF